MYVNSYIHMYLYVNVYVFFTNHLSLQNLIGNDIILQVFDIGAQLRDP